MERTISVTGTGSVSVQPNQIVVSLTLRTVDPDYDRSMKQSSELLEQLKQALAGIGFDEETLKTTQFNVSAEYESIRNPKGEYRNVFRGYAVLHGLKLAFDFDSARLSQVLSAVSRSVADPELSVQFTVKDRNAVSEALLTDAAANAKKKAEILARASGVTLGSLLSIQYDWGDRPMYSPTAFRMEAKCAAYGSMADSMNFSPDQIELTDSAAFVWEIL